ncbi:MAG: FumA C-terminus/TtdB family hydratase beta subunit, partial [Actinobacteria bacterium]|nr:FumA C-terminus/TtdB family hydratase beta subunit [Actinomycetota bacterium]
MIRLKTPLTIEKIKSLKAKDEILLSGTIYGVRDAAHKRLAEAIHNNENLPFDLKDAVIFYVGPSPTPPGKNSGAIGPTTSERMDKFTEPLLKKGIRATIGKGDRSPQVKDLMKKYGSIYLTVAGGISALLASKIKEIKTIAYEDLGPEAVFKIKVKDFPLFVAYDLEGNDIF